MLNRFVRGFVVVVLIGATVPIAASGALAAGPGAPWTWGTNTSGELGDGSTSPHFDPAAVPGLGDVTDLHGGRQHVVALRQDGSVVAWGRNNFGQLGVGGGSRTSPVTVPGVANAIAVETGHYHSLALLPNGTVLTWGYNAFGQLGDGTTTHRSSPVQVSGLNDAVAIAAGRNMSYAIRSNGTVWGWGLNSDGQLGDGTTTSRTTPVRVGSLTNAVSIAGGRDHGLAVLTNGQVWAWGDNRHGQLGDGTRTDRTQPQQIVGGAEDVIAGAHHSYALMSNGTVQAWGRNYRGALGDGTIDARRTSPGAVLNVTNAVAIGSGRDHGLAVLADGSVRSWGYNAAGQLGDGTTTTRTSAITVPGLGGAEIVAGGRDYSVALVSDGPPPPNQAPTARITSSCSGLSCSFSGETSWDPDGTIVGYSWTFGDGGTGSGVSVGHTYPSADTYTVGLTVTDDDGATDSTTAQITVSDVAADVSLRAVAEANQNAVTSQVTIPGSVQPGDQLVLIVTVNKAVSLTTPAGWTVLGSEDDGAPDMRSWLLTRTATAGLPGTSVAVTTSARAKRAVTLAAYAGAGPVTLAASANESGSATMHTTPQVAGVPAGSVVVNYWSDKTAGSSWSLPGSVTLLVESSGSGGGQINAVLAASGPSGGGTWPGATATSSATATKAIMWSVILAPS